jgi:hypothetical protein
MENTTIITLAPSTDSSTLSVRTTASFEEAFGDYSNAKGKGRARRKTKKLTKISDKQEVKQARKGGRQEDRISRRSTRKGARQDIRASQQDSRLERKGKRRDAREEDTEDDKDETATDTQNGSNTQQDSGSSDSQDNGGSSDGQQGGGDSNDWGAPPQGSNDEQDNGGSSDSQQDGGGSNDWGAQPQGYDEGQQDGGDGAYGDDNRYDTPYNQEDSEFADESHFNLEGMEGKSSVSPMVKDNVEKLRNNQRAYKDLSDRRNLMLKNGDNTRGIEMQLRNCQGRVNELKSSLDSYANADGNPETKNRRRNEVSLALGRGKKRRMMTDDGGSEVPVSRELNSDFKPNRIEINPKSGFDGYSDLGRPVFIDGVEQSDKNDYSSDLLNDGAEPTTVDLFSNLDGDGGNKKIFLSVAIGIGVGALAIFIAKKKGWI